MTESKPQSSNRVIRPGVAAAASTAAALGRNYSVTSPFSLIPPRAKPSDAVQISGNATSVPPLITTAVSTQFHVTVPLSGSAKEPLKVTGYFPKGPSAYPIDNTLVVPLSTNSTETRVKVNTKNVELQKVNFVRQIATAGTKSRVSAAANIVRVPQKKDSEIIKPVLLGPGLRQPQSQATKPGVFARQRIAPIHPSSWAISQQDTEKATVSNSGATIMRTKPAFHNLAFPTPQDSFKKHTISQQPRSTVSITPSPPPGHRNTALTVAPFAGNKSIYQVLASDFQTAIPVANNAIKKIPMALSQAISLPLSNSPSSKAQVTVMTCGVGITHVPIPTPLNGTNSTSIPIAKVYPQQQPPARISVTSTTSGSLTPRTSPLTASITRATPTLIQVAPIKSTPTTSIVVATQTTIMSTMPVAMNKPGSSTNRIGSVLCWPGSFGQAHPASVASSTVNLRPSANSLTTIPPTQQSGQMPGVVRMQQHNLVLVEPKTAHLQATAGSAPSVLQVPDNRTVTSVPHNTTNPPVAGTSTMSPRPTILRKQRPETATPKKLYFPTTQNIIAQRSLNQKPADARHAPYSLNRQKLANKVGDLKADIPMVIHPGSHGDRNDAKPTVENQMFIKQQLNSGSGLTQLKLSNSLKPHVLPFPNSAKDGGNHLYSIHPVVDSKVKVESGYSVLQNSIKSEPASASQMLQFQNQSMHTYATESPQAISSVQHRIISQVSGHHITTNTIFTKPSAHPAYPSYQVPRLKPTHVGKSKSALVGNAVSRSQSDLMRPGSHGVNLFSTRKVASSVPERGTLRHDYIKREQSHLQPTPGLEQTKSGDVGISQLLNHGSLNRTVPIASPAKVWLSNNNSDVTAGLSPRKRPRKQTHVVSEDQPVVMEDEESTDDADECEDEPMPEAMLQHPSLSTTPTTKLPGNKAPPPRPVKSDPYKRTSKEESVHKTRIKSESASSVSTDSKPPSEYTDQNGVRYVASRKRPNISVLNRLKPNSRSIANHFMHYSDVKCKEKKTTIVDLATDRKRLKGVKVARFALQLQDMIDCEKDIWKRMQDVHDGLVKYRSTLLGDVTFDGSVTSPSPGTPSFSSSFCKPMARSARSGSAPAAHETDPIQSPSTPLDQKVNKVKDDIATIEEIAQANLQRCRVVSEQMQDTKTMLLKVVDHRQLVTDILDSSNSKKSRMSTNAQTTKRLPKKKS